MATILDNAVLEFSHHCRALQGSDRIRVAGWRMDGGGRWKQGGEAGNLDHGAGRGARGSGGAQRHIEDRISWSW